MTLIAIMSGPRRNDLIDVLGAPLAVSEPLQFVPVFDFYPRSIVGKPVDDWRAAAAFIQAHRSLA